MAPFFRARHFAMATEFEVIIAQDDVDAAYAGQAAEAVFAEVDRLEEELSRFKPGSDIWRINNLKAGQSCPIGLATLDCLQLAKAVHAETSGAFDITVGPLMDIFRNGDGTPRTPSEEEEELARARVGLHVYEVSDGGFASVSVDHPRLDLGAVGKGYALDQAVTVLADYSIRNALLNAGDSTVLGIGAPPGDAGWVVTAGNDERVDLRLSNRALSASGLAVQGSHIMNPRLMKPIALRKNRVWASAPTAALSDALSTAFMVMEKSEIVELCIRNPEVQSILA